jgi:hypothetical protein
MDNYKKLVYICSTNLPIDIYYYIFTEIYYYNNLYNNINYYSFSLYPENYQPSGIINFSRIDDATINLYFS